MNKKEITMLIETVADKVADKIISRMQVPQGNTYPDMVDSNEAARILGVSRQYLLQIKDKYSYRKLGDNKQSRIMFNKEDLMREISGCNGNFSTRV